VSIHVGTSGWSYPSWRPGFYPAGTKPADFLAHYAARFDTVELNTTAYRVPAPEQFARWAAAVPAGFTFAPKLAFAQPERLRAFVKRIGRLDDRLGPLRIVVQAARDDDLLRRLVEVAGDETPLAFDFRHDSWSGVEGVVAVNDLDAEPFRYIRLREPPYTEDDLLRLAAAVRPPAFVYFRHEDEPSAPAYAARLLELVRGDARQPG
jgi:uncharacterized protein YecE (DUF72 family)